MTSCIPDVNVWIALNHDLHDHHFQAVRWFDSLDQDAILYFCRLTQISFLRLLSSKAVMKTRTLTQNQCWEQYALWIEGGRAGFLEEPTGIHKIFRSLTSKNEIAPKAWNDLYLAAFAEATELSLVTFDQALAGKTKGAVLLS